MILERSLLLADHDCEASRSHSSRWRKIVLRLAAFVSLLVQTEVRCSGTALFSRWIALIISENGRKRHKVSLQEFGNG